MRKAYLRYVINGRGEKPYMMSCPAASCIVGCMKTRTMLMFMMAFTLLVWSLFRAMTARIDDGAIFHGRSAEWRI